MPRRILRVSRKSIRKSRKLVRKSRKSVRKSRSNTKARVGGGKDSSVDYSTIKEKVIKFPFRDDLHLTLKKGHKVDAYNAKMVYCSDTISSKRKLGGLGNMFRRKMLDESAVLKQYKAEEDGELRLYQDENERRYDIENYADYNFNPYEMFSMELTGDEKSLLVRDDDNIMVTTSNFDLKIDTQVKGLISSAKKVMPRFDLDGDYGKAWLTAPPVELLKVKEGEKIKINPAVFVAAAMKNKKCYKVKTSISPTKFNRGTLRFEGPARIYILKPDLSETMTKYRYKMF